MNLLCVHERLGSFGGAEANLFASASALARRGHRLGLLTQQATGRNEPAWRDLFADDPFFLGDAVPFGAFDAIYVHKWEHQPTLETLLAAPPPTVRMVHDHDIYCLRSYRYNPLTRRVCTRPLGGHCVFPCLAPLKRSREGKFPIRWASFFEKQRELALARRFDLNLVATDYMRRELLLNGFPPDRIAVVPPVPPPSLPLESRFSDRNLLVFAGQLIRGKGVDVMLRALAKVQTPFEAVILGEGGHRAKCETLARKLGLASRVTFHGFVPFDEMRAFYQEATAVLVPSVWPEPMGLVGLEAMRWSLPVVGFDAGGIGEWLTDGENGFLVPWMDTARFAAAVDTLLNDKPLARAMGRRGRERADRDFDFDAYIDRLESVFAHVVQGREDRPGPSLASLPKEVPAHA